MLVIKSICVHLVASLVSNEICVVDYCVDHPLVDEQLVQESFYRRVNCFAYQLYFWGWPGLSTFWQSCAWAFMIVLKAFWVWILRKCESLGLWSVGHLSEKDLYAMVTAVTMMCGKASPNTLYVWQNLSCVKISLCCSGGKVSKICFVPAEMVFRWVTMLVLSSVPANEVSVLDAWSSPPNGLKSGIWPKEDVKDLFMWADVKDT